MKHKRLIRYPKIKSYYIHNNLKRAVILNPVSHEPNGGSVVELTVCEKNGMNIFTDSVAKYVIPIYQRPYTWKSNEIEQFIDDLNSINELPYYIGSLIVYRSNKAYEVIDGQQRLTTLFLLFIALEIPILKSISFACRKKANMTIDRLIKAFSKNGSFDCKVMDKIINKQNRIDSELDYDIVNGIKIIFDKIDRDNIKKHDLKKALEFVKLFRIEVPPHTDLNHYFQIMNTRGEQLAQHDILKAKLLSFIKDGANRNNFAVIWDACVDMTGYVQMHFRKEDRESIFGEFWNNIPNRLRKIRIGTIENHKYICLDDILESPQEDKFSDKLDAMSNYDSIIDFQHFLLHVLRVYCDTRKVTFHDGVVLRKVLDDINLLHDFELVLDQGIIKTKKKTYNIREHNDEFALDFIFFLLKCRFIFDKYIIKREYQNEFSDGEWSLKQLKAYIRNRNSKNDRYIYTFSPINDNNTSLQRININTKIVQLQSALRVSYTSPKTMHWITDLLKWLIKNLPSSIDGNNYFEEINRMTTNFVKNDFLIHKNLNLGVRTPHIVFNYLDYLLWQENERFADFKFEFRNSVEHWYPRNPYDGERWKEEEFDNFGNLCLIQRDINSRFSNLLPKAKQHYVSKIANASLKLRLMAEETHKADIAKKDWKDLYKNFGDEMILKLKIACGMT